MRDRVVQRYSILFEALGVWALVPSHELFSRPPYIFDRGLREPGRVAEVDDRDGKPCLGTHE